MAAAIQLNAHQYMPGKGRRIDDSSKATLGNRPVQTNTKAPGKVEESTKKVAIDALKKSSRIEYAKAIGYASLAFLATFTTMLLALSIVNLVVAFVELLMLPLYFLFPPAFYAIGLALFVVLGYFALFAVKHIVYDPIADQAVRHAVKGAELSRQAQALKSAHA